MNRLEQALRDAYGSVAAEGRPPSPEAVRDTVVAFYEPLVNDLVILASKHTDIWTKADYARFAEINRITGPIGGVDLAEYESRVRCDGEVHIGPRESRIARCAEPKGHLGPHIAHARR